MNNLNKKRRIVCFLLTIYTLFSFLAVSSSASEKAERVDTLNEYDVSVSEESVSTLSEDVRVGSRLFELFFGEEKESKQISLIPGGDVFGVKIKQDHVTVIESGRIPGLKRGDKILSVNGKEIHSTDDISKILKASKGESLTLRVEQGGEELKIEVKPLLEDGEYKLGVSLRDGALGIGTVTFIDPETGLFGGLGHGISDSDSGQIVSMSKGDVTGVILGGVHKGEKGKPGELTGVLTDTDLGDLYTNSECGVFGIFEGKSFDKRAAIPVGRKEELHAGEATVISTVRNGKKAEYKIEISEIDRSSEGSKSFKIKVSDPTLLALTGGIVRGMSGSPILQDGKLIGAVTHVLVADPTEGYGIFIENMINSSNVNNNSQKAA